MSDDFPPFDDSWAPDGSNTPETKVVSQKVINRDDPVADPNSAAKHVAAQQGAAPPPEQPLDPEQALEPEQPPADTDTQPPELRDTRAELIEQIAQRSQAFRERQQRESIENGGDPYGVLGPEYAETPEEEPAAQEQPATPAMEGAPPTDLEKQLGEIEQTRIQQQEYAQKLNQWYESMTRWEQELQQKQQQPEAPEPIPEPKPYTPPQEVIDDAAKLWMSGNEDEAKQGINAILNEAARIAESRATPPQTQEQLVDQISQQAMARLEQRQFENYQRQKESTRTPAATKFSNDYPDIAGNEKLMHLAGLEATRIEQEHPDWDYYQVFDNAGKSLQEALGTAKPPKEEMQQRAERKAGTVVNIPSNAASRRRPPTRDKEPTRAEIIEQIRASRPGSGI